MAIMGEFCSIGKTVPITLLIWYRVCDTLGSFYDSMRGHDEITH